MFVDPDAFVSGLNASWDADDVPVAVAASFAEAAVMCLTGDTSPGASANRGHQQLEVALRAVRVPFPGFRETFTVVAQHEHRIVEWIATGTRSGGPYEGTEPRDRRINFPGVNIFEIDDADLTKVERPFWDPSLLVGQLTD